MNDQTETTRGKPSGAPLWRLMAGAVVVALVVTGAVGAVIFLATRNIDAKLALRPDPGVATLSVPEFSMTSQDGETVTQDIFENNLTIIEFGFTHCPAARPIMMDKMLRLQEELEGTPARFVFVSVDPVHDTPERLREYARENGVDMDRWTLLTGEYEEVRRWLVEGLDLSLEQQPETPIELDDGTTMANIAHPSHLILIGPDTRILGLFPAFADFEIDRLAERVKTASKLWEG